MDAMVYALVDDTGTVYADEGVTSYTELARQHGVDEGACDLYRFDLVQRQIVPDRVRIVDSRRAARAYFHRRLGSPEQLIAVAQQGRLSKELLAMLLPAGDRQAFLEACAAVERRYTESCASNGGCLESGCSMDDDERCLQPLVNAPADYQHACAEEWIKWFASPLHRVPAWEY